MSATGWLIIAIVLFSLSFIFLVAAVFMFLKYKIPTVIDDLSGKRVAREIRAMHERNQEGGGNSNQISAVGAGKSVKSKTTSDSSKKSYAHPSKVLSSNPSAKAENEGSRFVPFEDSGEKTEVLNTENSGATEVLYAEDKGGTAVLSAKETDGTEVLYSDNINGTEILSDENTVGTEVLYANNINATEVLSDENTVGTEVLHADNINGTEVLFDENTVGTEVLYTDDKIGTEVLYADDEIGTEVLSDENAGGTEVLYPDSENGTVLLDEPYRENKSHKAVSKNYSSEDDKGITGRLTVPVPFTVVRSIVDIHTDERIG